MIKGTPHAAFGILVYIMSADAGDTQTISLAEDGSMLGENYFFVKGRAKVIETATGVRLEDRVPGHFNIEHGKTSSIKTDLSIEYLEDSNWVCISNGKTQRELPSISSMSLVAGSSTTVQNNKNIFLANGECEVNGRLFTAPAQIRVRSGDVALSAVTDCFLLDIK